MQGIRLLAGGTSSCLASLVSRRSRSSFLPYSTRPRRGGLMFGIRRYASQISRNVERLLSLVQPREKLQPTFDYSLHFTEMLRRNLKSSIHNLNKISLLPQDEATLLRHREVLHSFRIGF